MDIQALERIGEDNDVAVLRAIIIDLVPYLEMECGCDLRTGMHGEDCPLMDAKEFAISVDPRKYD